MKSKAKKDSRIGPRGLPDPNEWDFRKERLPDSEVAACCAYEYAREALRQPYVASLLGDKDQRNLLRGELCRVLDRFPFAILLRNGGTMPVPWLRLKPGEKMDWEKLMPLNDARDTTLRRVASTALDYLSIVEAIREYCAGKRKRLGGNKPLRTKLRQLGALRIRNHLHGNVPVFGHVPGDDLKRYSQNEKRLNITPAAGHELPYQFSTDFNPAADTAESYFKRMIGKDDPVEREDWAKKQAEIRETMQQFNREHPFTPPIAGA